MPKMTLDLKGLDAYERILALVKREAKQVANKSLYAGGAVTADALRERIDGLWRVPDVVAINAWRKHKPTWLSVSQKNGLRDGLGIAKFKIKGGVRSTKIGFEGYNSVRTARWPKGQPNVMIAAAVEHGTTHIVDEPFIRPMLEEERREILRAMIKAGTDEVDKIIDKW